MLFAPIREIGKSEQITRIPPLGLFYIASYLNSKGHQVKIVDSRDLILKYSVNNYELAIISSIREFKPDIIGVNTLTANFNEAVYVTKVIKSCAPDIPLIMGGVHPSVEPVLTLKQIPEIDAVCVGEGEEVILELAEGRQDIKGLMRRDCIEKYEKRQPELNIDKYPFPDFRLGNAEFYTRYTENTLNKWHYRGLGLITSRSCPYSCKFCASDWSKPYRTHSAGYVVKMTSDIISKYDIDAICFYDDSLGNDKKRLLDICDSFIKLRLFRPHSRIKWFSLLRANQVSREILQAMKEAGCFAISIGIESGSDRVLGIINKKTSVEINHMACQLVKKVGLHLITSFMVGIPGETKEDIEQTMRFIRQNRGSKTGIGIFRPLPGSQFYYELIKNPGLVNWNELGNFTKLSTADPIELVEAFNKAQFICSGRLGYLKSIVRGLVR